MPPKEKQNLKQAACAIAMQLCVLVRVGSPGGPDLDLAVSC